MVECPPSKPTGIKHDYYYPQYGWCVPKITWDHNTEPDMLREDNTKRYQIWRATRPNMSQCFYPENYILIDTKDIPANETPEYIDFSVQEWDCALLDQMPPFGIQYPLRYKVKAVDINNDISVFSEYAYTNGISPEGGIEDGGDNPFTNIKLPSVFDLSQNYPNPFNPVTNIKYDLPKDIFVTIKIYDILGREIKILVNEFKNAGSYIASFNGSELASGVYFYKIQAGSFVQVKRMVLIK